MSGVATSGSCRIYADVPGTVSLQLVGRTGAPRIVLALCAAGAGAAALALTFVPWQQSVTAKGQVAILSPMARPQTVEAQIPARVAAVHVREGQSVKTGALLAELADLDPKFLDAGQHASLMGQREALKQRRDAAARRLAALLEQRKRMGQARPATLSAASSRARQATARERQAEQALLAARQAHRAARQQLDRVRRLHRDGLRSRRDLELAELDEVRAATELARSVAALAASRNDSEATLLDGQKIANETAASLSGLEASVAAVHEALASVDAELRKLDVDLANVRSRQAQRQVTAPCDGLVVRLPRAGTGSTVKPGDTIAVLAPAGADPAVELRVSGNDAPLVSPGRQVRLQFAGWPALQVSGWPSIAVGTFAGRVAVVDAIDDGTGSYRILVVPDPENVRPGGDDPWPPLEQLRPGMQAIGWIMLDEVSLGFELWRQLNAFPPSLRTDGERLAAPKVKTG